MTLCLASRQLAVSLEDVVNGLLQARARLVERVLLHVAARQLFNEARPPVINLLEHAGVPVLHEDHSLTMLGTNARKGCVGL